MRAEIFTSTGLRAALAGMMVCLAAASAPAATMSWQQPQIIIGDGDVSTDGTLVAAFNLAHAATTVNGVTFAEFQVGNPVNTVGNFTLSAAFGNVSSGNGGSLAAPFANLSADYRALLDTTALSQSNVGLTLTMAGLTVGTSYQLQVWNNKSEDFNPPGFTFDSKLAAGNSVDLDPNPSTLEGGLGEHVIGTFVADSTTQAVTIDNSEIGGVLNAFHLREVLTAPAQTTPAVSAVGMVALCTALLLAGCIALHRQDG